MLKISAFLFNTSADSHDSPTTFSCSNIILHQWWSNLIWFKNENLFMVSHCHPSNNTRYVCVYVPASTRKEDILGFWLSACCKLALTLARQIWRHNYVIRRNEYLISTLLASTVPELCSLQFLFKSTHYSLRYERNCESVFFLNTVYTWHPT